MSNVEHCIGMPTPVRSVKKIKLNKKKLVLKKGKKYKLKYTITPSKATNKMVDMENYK